MSRTRESARKAGTEFVTAVCRYLSEALGVRIGREPLHGSRDEGDVAGLVTGTGLRIAVECKDYAGKYGGKLPGWLDEAECERENAGADLGVVIVKRAGCGDAKMGHQFVVMTLETLAQMVRAGKEES